MHFLSFFYVIAFALATNASDSHFRYKPKHHAAAAFHAQCRPRLQPSSVEPALPREVLSTSSVPARTATLSRIPTTRPTTPTSSQTSTSTRIQSSTTSKTASVASSSSHSSPVQSSTPAAPSVTGSQSSFTPNSIKAGIAGGDAYPYLKDHIGWWYDWSPNPSKAGPPIAVPMLWGGGTADAQDAARLAAFEQISAVPPYVLGFEEPDCPSGSGSAGMTVDAGVAKWEAWIAPMKAKGAKLGSPSMCKQLDETWLAEFQKKITTPWDFTAVHINKNTLDGVKEDIEHYLQYGKPIWVTEFACVNDHPNFVPCTDQAQINTYINDIVSYLQGHPNVFAYAYSNGLGLGDVWPLVSQGGILSESGKSYLAAISKYH